MGAKKDNRIGIKEFVGLVDEKVGSFTTKKDAERMVRSVFDCVVEQLSEGMEVSVPGFGVFCTKDYPEREMNVALHGTGKVTVPARTRVLFRPALAMKNKVSGILDA